MFIALTGLFQKAIIMSPLDIWKAIDKDMDVNATETERMSRDIARALSCNSQLDQEILQCVRARSLPDIMALYSVNFFKYSNLISNYSSIILGTCLKEMGT